jgi:hypothetical protein
MQARACSVSVETEHAVILFVYRICRGEPPHTSPENAASARSAKVGSGFASDLPSPAEAGFAQAGRALTY